MRRVKDPALDMKSRERDGGQVSLGISHLPHGHVNYPYYGV